MRQLASVFVKQHNGLNPCRKKRLDGCMESHSDSLLVRACIHQLHLVNQQRTSGNPPDSLKTGFNSSLELLLAVFQGYLKACTQKLLGITLHDDKDGYAHQQGNGHQNYSSDQTDSMLTNFWLWHVFQGRIGRGHETVLLRIEVG